MSSPNEKLYDILRQQMPSSILAVTQSTIPALETYRQEQSCEVTVTPSLTDADIYGLPRQDLVIISDWLEHHSRKDGLMLLGALRNRLNPRILVAVDESQTDWTFSEFLGLGFRREGRFTQEDRGLSLYSYDIASYNHKRTWNNPENWANPENWGKYWW